MWRVIPDIGKVPVQSDKHPVFLAADLGDGSVSGTYHPFIPNRLHVKPESPQNDGGINWKILIQLELHTATGNTCSRESSAA